ncbi:MAG: ribosome maturation factor RimM [Candidatus Hinthialibacter antarcticus]|nr:ribosome maturation factor RimM [Candidatus Hinthialibacter antarcticus]
MTLRRKKPKVDLQKIYLGRILRPHALKGEVKLSLFGCDPIMLEELECVYVDQSDRVLKIEYIRGTDKAPIVKFEGVNSREGSDALYGLVLWAEPGQLPDLEDDFFYEADFLYAQAQLPSGEVLGRIDQVIETGAIDVLLIRTSNGEEVLIPATREFVHEIRREDSIIVVDPPELDW